MAYEDVSAAAFRILLRHVYTGEVPEREDGSGGSGGQEAGVGRRAGRSPRSKGGAGSGGKGKGRKEDGEEAAEEEAESWVQELLRVADRFQAAGLYKHCLEEFGRSMTAETAMEALVWAHTRGPEGAREVAEGYFVRNLASIQVLLLSVPC